MPSALTRCRRTMSRFGLKCREVFDGLRLRLKPVLRVAEGQGSCFASGAVTRWIGSLVGGSLFLLPAGYDPKKMRRLVKGIFDFNAVLLAPLGAGNDGGFRSQQR